MLYIKHHSFKISIVAQTSIFKFTSILVTTMGYIDKSKSVCQIIAFEQDFHTINE